MAARCEAAAEGLEEGGTEERKEEKEEGEEEEESSLRRTLVASTRAWSRGPCEEKGGRKGCVWMCGVVGV